MNKLMIAALVATASCALFADDGEVEAGTQKVILKISTVETVGTRTEKTWNPPAMPSAVQEVPYNEADMATATPEEARQMARANRERRLSNQAAQAAQAFKAYQDASQHYEGVKKQLEGTTFGRQVILAVDKFAGMAGEYFDPDCIEFFHRMDMDEGDKESFLKDMSSAEVITAPYFIKLVFDDPRIESGKVVMNGQEITRKKITQGITYQVQDLRGKMITSGNVRKDKMSKSTNAVITSGKDDNMMIDVIEEALAEVAKRINKFFVAKSTIKLIGPKKDSDFDPDAATIEIDGVQQDADTEFSVMKGSHTIVVDLDGFKQKGSTKFQIRKDGTIKISLKKEAAKKEAKDSDE